MFASKVLIPLCLVLASSLVLAKLPAPSDEAKAKAAEAAAKTAWTGKVADFQLCKAQDKVAGAYMAQQKKAAAPAAKPASGVPACADPGPFAYVPPASASAPAAAAAPAAAPPAAKKT